MDIFVQKGNLLEEPADLCLFGTFQGEAFSDAAQKADERCGNLLSRIAKEELYKGKEGQTLMIRLEGRLPAKRVLLIGLGKRDAFTRQGIREAAAVGLRCARSLRAKRVACELLSTPDTTPKQMIQAMTEGMLLSGYTFGTYKKTKDKEPQAVTIFTTDARIARSGAEAVQTGTLFSRATMAARDLVNAPGQHMRPEDLVEATKQLLSGKKGVKMRVFDQEKLEKMKAGALLGVAQGSDHPPALVHMIYTPPKKAKKKIALVGKAITFDSGGLSLKPADYMMGMKADMGGAAAVIGLFSVIAELAPNVEIHGIYGAAENMPSGRAIRPGDVVTAMNGKTIEIWNTDAEGRVTLADTLSYAVKQKPDVIIDLATLTGACMVALGEEISALMTNTDDLGEQVLAASKRAGEKMWPLPLEKAYKESALKSDIADLKNIGGRWGGAITAGLFLEEFVNGIPWVHLDIAGPAHTDRPLNAFTPKGGTGQPVRSLLEFVRAL